MSKIHIKSLTGLTKCPPTSELLGTVWVAHILPTGEAIIPALGGLLLQKQDYIKIL